MNWLITRNTQAISHRDIPVLDFNTLRKEILIECKNCNKRPIAFFGLKKNSIVKLFVALVDDENSNICIASSYFENVKSYPSLTVDIPAFHMFEREFFEEYGIKPEGHPWLKPVRYSYNRFNINDKIKDYPFFKMEGEEIHEVAVGPVHAGIIEPGHFRFMCHGENVYHLEIQLGYQHRGIENIFLEKEISFFPHVAETIAGDSSIAHATACVNALEELGEINVPRKAQSIRAIALELERIAMHLGDLAALAGDVGYLMGNAVFAVTRTLAINTTMAICGSRLGRGLIKTGGVAHDINNDTRKLIMKNLKKILHDTELMAETMFSSASVLSRFEHTGIVTKDDAIAIGMTGMAARASGVPLDIRTDHPYGIFREYPIHKITLDGGDVFCRAYIRYVEIKQSLNFIMEQLDFMDEKENIMGNGKETVLKSDSFVISMTEGFRGEIAHCIITDERGRVIRYKIKDPSFNNWYALALAVRNNGISDFPLCNKSFNLSYCGFDL